MSECLIWFDVVYNQMYIATRNYTTTEFSGWVNINSVTQKLILTNDVFTYSPTGEWASVPGNLTHAVCLIDKIKVSGCTSCIVEWSSRNVDGEYIDSFEYSLLDEDGSCIRNVTFSANNDNMQTVIGLSNTAYSICFSLMAPSGKGLPNGSINVTLCGCNDFNFIKNQAFSSNQTGVDWHRFGYKVCDEIIDGTLTAVYSTGVVKFPPNYSQEGKACPVILMVHGSTAYLRMRSDPAELPQYEPFYNFLRDCGFALIDCFPWTDRYDGRLTYTDSNGTTNTISNPWPIPTNYKAYEKLIDICIRGFNFNKDNIFIMTKSLGGQVASMLSAKFNFKACGFLAPALMLNLGYSASIYRELIAEDLELVGLVDSDIGWDTEADCMTDFYNNFISWSSSKKLAFYLHNEDKLMGITSEFYNTVGNTAVEKLNLASKYQGPSATNLCKVNYPPTKIWVARDDDAVSFNMCVTYVQQVRNGGGFGTVREMSIGTGGHHSVDTDPNAPKVATVTTPLGIIHTNVPVAYVELYEFFEKYTT